MTDSEPLISVIITTYNRLNVLPRAINSVLNQTYPNFELIIIDGGSNYNVEEIINQYNDKRIRFFKQKENKGMLADRNLGFRLSQGKYIAILDDDDELLKDALENAANAFQDLAIKEIKFIWFNCIDLDTNKFTGSGIDKDGYISYDDCLYRKIEGEFWLVFEKEILAQDAFDERLWGGECILWLKLLRRSKAFYIHKGLRIYHRDENDISNFRKMVINAPRIAITYEAFLNEYGEDLRINCPGVYRQNLFDLAIFQFLNGEKDKCRKSLMIALQFGFDLKCITMYTITYLVSSYVFIRLGYLIKNHKRLKSMLISKLG